MIRLERREMKKEIARMNRWYAMMARKPDGTVEGYFERWDRVGRMPIELSPPLAVIGVLSRILERTK